MDEPFPDHSSRTRIRQRFGSHVCQRFFAQAIDLSQDAGRGWGRERYGAAAKVEANPGIPSRVPRCSFEATTHLADLVADTADDMVLPVASDLPLGIGPLPVATERIPPADNRPGWLAERRLDPRRPAKRGDRRTSDVRLSPTDPDAPPRGDWGAIPLGDHDPAVVDGGNRRIMLAALVTPADVMVSQAMREGLSSTRPIQPSVTRARSRPSARPATGAHDPAFDL